MHRKPILDRLRDPSPALLVKFMRESDETPQEIKTEHVLGSRPDTQSRGYLKSLEATPDLNEFVDFYNRHDGFQFCRTFHSRHKEVRPLLELKAAAGIDSFTNRYRPGGDLAWTMDLNKSQSLYRSSSNWLAFAEIASGPACLTIFLDGDHSGCVFFVTPQPSFNILRPIAKSFNALLDRIATDPAAFLRTVRARVTMRGIDGDNYGLIPMEYLSEATQQTIPNESTGKD